MSSNIYLAPSPVAPMFLLVSNITRSTNAVVTVTTANKYVVGQLLHFSIPQSYGMYQIDKLIGKILYIDETNLIFTTDIDSTQFDSFVTASTYQEQPATVASYGSRNIYNYTSLPFHSINGMQGN